MDLPHNLFVHTGKPAADWGAAPAFGADEEFLQALCGPVCASPVGQEQSPSCPSSNQSSASDVQISGSGAGGVNLENQLQQLVEPGRGSFAPFAGYHAAQQQMPLFNTSGLGAAPVISSFANMGAARMLPQQSQHQYHASAAMQYPAAHTSSAQHPAAAALAEPLSSNHQEQLIELLLNPQYQQHVVPQPNDVPRQCFLQPYPQQQQPQQHRFESCPLVLPHELQQLQVLVQPKQEEPTCYAYHPQQQLVQPIAAPQRQQHPVVQTAKQILAAADAAAAARRPASRGPTATQAGSKRTAAKALKEPKQAAMVKVSASSEDEAPVPAAPKKRGRPPLNPGKYSRGYLAIKAYRQRKKGMVEGMEADIEAMQQQVQQLEEERAALELKHQVLQAAITASDEVLSQMAALQVHPPTAANSITTSSSSNSSTGLGASSDDAAEALNSALVAVQANGTHPADAPWEAVLRHVEYELRRNATQAQQQAQQRSQAAAFAAARRQNAYVQSTAEHLAQGLLPASAQNQHRSNSPVSPAAHSSSTGYAAFPHGVADLLHLAQLQRNSVESTNNVSNGYALMLDLQSGQSTELGRASWAGVAQQMPAASPRQQLQLQALWDVYNGALGRLAQDRQQLLTQLSAHPVGSAGIEGSLRTAAAVESYASRARAITLTYEWALQGLLTSEQVAKMCMSCWPYMPAVGALVSHLLGRADAA